MKLVDVIAAIYTRLAADTTLVNTYLGSSNNILFGQMPKSADATGNILIFNIYGTSANDTATKDIEFLSIEFTILVRRDGAQGPDAGLLILDRLHGDAVDNAGNVPTYGLHRYKLPLSGGVASTHSVTALQRVSFGPVDNEIPDTYFAVQATYSGYIQTL